MTSVLSNCSQASKADWRNNSVKYYEKIPSILAVRLFSLVAVYFTLTINASPQDCNALLVPDVDFTQMDLTTRLSYLAIITKDNFEAHKTSASASAYSIYGLFSGNFDNFNTKRESLYQQYGLTDYKKDLSSYYTSRLPIERAKLYAENCLHRHGFFAHVERADEEEVLLRVEWDKGAHDPNEVPLEFSFLKGGKPVSSDLPKKLVHAQPKDIAFERKPGSDFHFVANVDGAEPQSVFIPRFIKEKPLDPTKTLAQQIRDGADFQVLTDNLKNPIGSIGKDFVLHGYYRQRGYEWTVWSAQHPAQPNHRFTYGYPGNPKEGIDRQEAPVNPLDHKMSLLGRGVHV
jgi:hypothetical protein